MQTLQRVLLRHHAQVDILILVHQHEVDPPLSVPEEQCLSIILLWKQTNFMINVYYIKTILCKMRVSNKIVDINN